MAWLDTQYAELLARATSLTLDTTALTAAHDAWATYLEALTPAWNDTSANTPLIYDLGLVDAVPGLSAPGSADWNTGTANNITDATDEVVVDLTYRRLVDANASAAMAARAQWTGGFTEAETLTVWGIVRRDTATAHSQFLLQADEPTHAPSQVTVAEILFLKDTGAFSVTTGTGGVTDIDGWFGPEEMLVWATGAIPDGTPDNTDIRPSIAPARGTTAAWTVQGTSLGSLDVRGFTVTEGTFDPDAWLNSLGRLAFRKRLADYRAQLAATQSNIDALIAMAYLVVEDEGGSATDIAEVSIPASFGAIVPVGYRTPGDGGGGLLRPIGTGATLPVAPPAGHPRLAPGESDSAISGGGTAGDGYWHDATPGSGRRWFELGT
jgi:hypothetical protein